MANIPIYGKLVNETTEQIIADADQIGMSEGGNAETAINNAKPFYAQYGVTTSAEIEAAYQAGRDCYCLYYPDPETTPHFVLQLPFRARTSSTYHDFGMVDGDSFPEKYTPYFYLVACDTNHWYLENSLSCSIQRAITNTTVTLMANAWSNGQQTVTVTGIKYDETAQLIQPVPASASRAAYEAAGVKAISQGTNYLTFSCESTPASDLTVYVIVTEVIVA